MAGVYSVLMANQTTGADRTLVFIRTATAIGTRSSMIEVLRAWISQNETETSQQLGAIIASKASAFGTYTSTAPTSHILGGVASGISGGTAGAAATSGTNASAEGAGTVTTVFEDGFNNLNGFLWLPTPEERIIVPLDTAVILKLLGSPTTTAGWNAGITFREIN